MDGGLATVADDEDDDMDDAASSTEVSSPKDRASRLDSPVLGENSAREELDTRKQEPIEFFRSEKKTELDENEDSDISGFANDLIQVSSDDDDCFYSSFLSVCVLDCHVYIHSNSLANAQKHRAWLSLDSLQQISKTSQCHRCRQ